MVTPGTAWPFNLQRNFPVHHCPKRTLVAKPQQLCQWLLSSDPLLVISVRSPVVFPCTAAILRAEPKGEPVLAPLCSNCWDQGVYRWRRNFFSISYFFNIWGNYCFQKQYINIFICCSYSWGGSDGIADWIAGLSFEELVWAKLSWTGLSWSGLTYVPLKRI